MGLSTALKVLTTSAHPEQSTALVEVAVALKTVLTEGIGSAKTGCRVVQDVEFDCATAEITLSARAIKEIFNAIAS